MKLCDLTQFYSPVSGGVKRYIAEKRRYLQRLHPDWEHVLIVPGEHDTVEHFPAARTYAIRSPLVSRTSRYRMILRLEAVERVLEREQPDLIECGDPYQLAWKGVHSGQALRIPVVGFYHSHFPEAYLRSAQKYLGRTATEFLLDLSRRYVRSLYNRFARTLVPSPALAEVLRTWGVANLAHTDLGVDTDIFRPSPVGPETIREELGIPTGPTLLLYVGRLAHEKNTETLWAAFHLLQRDVPGEFHLLIVGDGLQRPELEALRAENPGSVTWMPYCDDAHRLAALYRAADLFVHPGVQETFGLVALESQACGTPVLGIHGSYMDRIIHNCQARWARENSAVALASAIREICTQDLRALGAAAALEVAVRYGWDEVFSRLFALYGTISAEYRLVYPRPTP